MGLINLIKLKNDSATTWKFAKITVSVLLVFILGLFHLNSGKASAKYRILVDGREIVSNVQPEMINERVIVPFRPIAEALGLNVNWEEATQTISATSQDTEVKFIINGAAYKNGIPITIDVPALLIDGYTMVPARFFCEAFGATVNWDQQTKSVHISTITDENELPVIGSYENLKTLLEQSTVSSYRYQSSEKSIASIDSAVSQLANSGSSSPPSFAENDGQSFQYSRTNTQVEGVDEADLVKTDGQYLYQANRNRIIVMKAHPPEEMQIIQIINYENDFKPVELYLDEKHLVVIGSSVKLPPVYAADSAKEGPDLYPSSASAKQTVKAIIYDLADKTNIQQTREIEVEGKYISSRKIDSALYLVTNRRIDWHYLQQYSETPAYRDTAISQESIAIDYAKIRYFPNCIQANYLIVAGCDLANPNAGTQVSTYLGSGEGIYVSPQNMYVVATKSIQRPVSIESKSFESEPVDKKIISPEHYQESEVYKFALGSGKIDYVGKGAVPGTILNQFSMDEYEDYFRIATTTGEVWRTDEFTSKNHVYVLDGNLNLIGRLENIAPGEKIYSTRFMGERLYMVTYKNTDPLFVIDLKDPQKPAVLGALKIPGYSDYLHPYDNNHIIGFGKDALEISEKDQQGNEVSRSAYYQGIKIALFDVSDVSNPIQMFSEIIGDRGTDSELLRSHKSLLFDRDRHLLAFPVTVMEAKKDATPASEKKLAMQYGNFAFQGAYVYHLDLESGFTLQSKITHLSAADYLNAGNSWYDSDKNIERIVYINNNIYSLSKSFITAHSLPDFKECGTLSIPY